MKTYTLELTAHELEEFGDAVLFTMDVIMLFEKWGDTRLYENLEVLDSVKKKLDELDVIKTWEEME